MAPLPRTTLLLAALLSHYHQLTHAMASPWSLLPSLRDHSAECVNGARLPALWFISDLVVTFTGEEPKEASFALGSLKANKASSLVTCRYNRVESGFGCTGQGEGGVRNPWGSVAKALVGGGKKMSPLLVELGGKAVVEEKEEEEEEAAKTTEKEMIDAMEEKLCSPSCLRETMPAPESGVVWTNGKKNLQVELRKRRPPSLGRGKPMMW
ncbi:hypothetical protein B0T18DRAFT_393209 [Schizothecium vesticola]|uniref:Uncharacterized protein n=1 Tax=Schizothecium vesticola TaxID=314040 RepID=A0AA40EJB9_9PEZI|nr:hypothetical protein B0T18DRAFT_393209 [Schizothecium vesticola]